MKIRPLEPNDFDAISPVIDEWWGGRPVRGLLPRLFFEHFQTTSFALTDEQNLAGFLVGFRSQSFPSVGYVHFLGVRPDVRAKGYGRLLYEHFFSVASGLGCTEVRAITSPVNESSIRFHLRLGFRLLPGNGEVGGFPVSLGHGGSGQPRVLFSKQLASKP
ncbi:MAG: GNAT family N-acetyltransferase [Gammaproteobacteria bacterium]|nr:GNAT family N-acetyltransferase [Gammaproteobacteria bacterium]MBU1480701.1 GNAT family N-acetyltransferase [Gammaproteobacteria bacterium]